MWRDAQEGGGNGSDMFASARTVGVHGPEWTSASGRVVSDGDAQVAQRRPGSVVAPHPAGASAERPGVVQNGGPASPTP
jgi:hypothetical protein